MQFGNLFGGFSVFAIFISILGLFALVSFSATLRIKEIGIRKVLGATTSNLLLLLSKEYLMLLIIAEFISIPIIYFLGNNWLNNYAFKTTLSIDIYLFPFLVLGAISLLTIGLQALKSSRVNPIKSLTIE